MHRAWALFLIPVGALGGCTPATARLEQPPLATRAPAGVEWSERASGLRVGPLDETATHTADGFWPRTDRVDAFDRSDGDATRRVTRTIDRTDAQRLHLSITVAEPGTDEVIAETDLVRAEDGSVRIARSNSGGVISVFDPPALFIPARSTAGETVTDEFAVTCTGRGIPGNPGTGTATITPLGAQPVLTAAGPVDAYAFDMTLAFRIGPARITFEQRLWYDDSGAARALIAEEGHDRVVVFGITFHDINRVSVLAETLGPGRTP